MTSLTRRTPDLRAETMWAGAAVFLTALGMFAVFARWAGRAFVREVVATQLEQFVGQISALTTAISQSNERHGQVAVAIENVAIEMRQHNREILQRVSYIEGRLIPEMVQLGRRQTDPVVPVETPRGS